MLNNKHLFMKMLVENYIKIIICNDIIDDKTLVVAGNYYSKSDDSINVSNK